MVSASIDRSTGCQWEMVIDLVVEIESNVVLHINYKTFVRVGWASEMVRWMGAGSEATATIDCSNLLLALNQSLFRRFFKTDLIDLK